LVAAILVGAGVVAAGGAAAAIVSSGHTAHVTKTAATQPETPASTLPSSPAVAATRSPAAAPTVGSSPAAQAVTYVVKHGDTLSGIADWFKLHGYGDLYSANIAQIGPNPNLIIPGERITISGKAMTIQSP
jgi:LysM repeat protein